MQSSSIVGELENNTVPASKRKGYALSFGSVQYVLILQYLDLLPAPQIHNHYTIKYHVPVHTKNGGKRKLRIPKL